MCENKYRTGIIWTNIFIDFWVKTMETLKKETRKHKNTYTNIIL